ncbi:uncharacterized protein G2W53_030930 [Senna tora]|uniref:Uncharacterized protein n=1 Tax=Senna tora TaxID=362788 RepID=A0A834T9V2_9FABA|nr:uncharacterized protein G2W53_030930 [Senna tora]
MNEDWGDECEIERDKCSAEDGERAGANLSLPLNSTNPLPIPQKKHGIRFHIFTMGHGIQPILQISIPSPNERTKLKKFWEIVQFCENSILNANQTQPK